jgi:hypothetical protein
MRDVSINYFYLSFCEFFAAAGAGLALGAALTACLEFTLTFTNEGLFFAGAVAGVCDGVCAGRVTGVCGARTPVRGVAGCDVPVGAGAGFGFGAGAVCAFTAITNSMLKAKRKIDFFITICIYTCR